MQLIIGSTKWQRGGCHCSWVHRKRLVLWHASTPICLFSWCAYILQGYLSVKNHDNLHELSSELVLVVDTKLTCVEPFNLLARFLLVSAAPI